MALALRKGGSDDALMVDINTTPLIDVMLVLPIMLIVTIPIRTDAVRLEMPGEATPAAQKAAVKIAIAEDGSITWDDIVLPDRAALEGRLHEMVQQNPQPELQLMPDRLAKYGSVATVLAAAQRLGVSGIAISEAAPER